MIGCTIRDQDWKVNVDQQIGEIFDCPEGAQFAIQHLMVDFTRGKNRYSRPRTRNPTPLPSTPTMHTLPASPFKELRIGRNMSLISERI